MSNGRRFRRAGQSKRTPAAQHAGRHDPPFGSAIAVDAARMRRENPRGYRRLAWTLRIGLGAMVLAIIVLAVIHW